MPNEPITYEYFRSAVRSAMHLEMRDTYMPDDPDAAAWLRGDRFDPAERWSGWFNLVAETTGRGVSVRRARIVSEPITPSIRFEYEVTALHNVKAGEQVRWLPRHQSAGLLVPPSDFWVFDERVVLWNHFDGNGSSFRAEVADSPELGQLCARAFEDVWARATPHEDYYPT